MNLDSQWEISRDYLWNELRGPPHGIVTKTVYKILPRGVAGVGSEVPPSYFYIETICTMQ